MGFFSLQTHCFKKISIVTYNSGHFSVIKIFKNILMRLVNKMRDANGFEVMINIYRPSLDDSVYCL